MTKEIETEHGSIVLDADWEDAVDYIVELVNVEDKIKHFNDDIRGEVRAVAYRVLLCAFMEYDFEDMVFNDDCFWEWFADQQKEYEE